MFLIKVFAFEEHLLSCQIYLDQGAQKWVTARFWKLQNLIQNWVQLLGRMIENHVILISHNFIYYVSPCRTSHLHLHCWTNLLLNKPVTKQTCFCLVVWPVLQIQVLKITHFLPNSTISLSLYSPIMFLPFPYPISHQGLSSLPYMVLRVVPRPTEQLGTH